MVGPSSNPSAAQEAAGSAHAPAQVFQQGCHGGPMLELCRRSYWKQQLCGAAALQRVGGDKQQPLQHPPCLVTPCILGVWSVESVSAVRCGAFPSSNTRLLRICVTGPVFMSCVQQPLASLETRADCSIYLGAVKHAATAGSLRRGYALDPTRRMPPAACAEQTATGG